MTKVRVDNTHQICSSSIKSDENSQYDKQFIQCFEYFLQSINSQNPLSTFLHGTLQMSFSSKMSRFRNEISLFDLLSKQVEPGISLPLTFDDIDDIITYKIIIKIITKPDIEQWVGCSFNNYMQFCYIRKMSKTNFNNF